VEQFGMAEEQAKFAENVGANWNQSLKIMLLKK
jgi:hypothetical protein